jgi:hypothetical protein
MTELSDVSAVIADPAESSCGAELIFNLLYKDMHFVAICGTEDGQVGLWVIDNGVGLIEEEPRTKLGAPKAR